VETSQKNLTLTAEQSALVSGLLGLSKLMVIATVGREHGEPQAAIVGFSLGDHRWELGDFLIEREQVGDLMFARAKNRECSVCHRALILFTIDFNRSNLEMK
jgi:hypothetical protein